MSKFDNKNTSLMWCICSELTHFMPLVSVYTPWKQKKRLSKVFRGYTKTLVVLNGLMNWTQEYLVILIVVNMKLMFSVLQILEDNFKWQIGIVQCFFHLTLSVYWKNETNTEKQNLVILRIRLFCVSNQVKQNVKTIYVLILFCFQNKWF